MRFSSYHFTIWIMCMCRVSTIHTVDAQSSIPWSHLRGRARSVPCMEITTARTSLRDIWFSSLFRFICMRAIPYMPFPTCYTEVSFWGPFFVWYFSLTLDISPSGAFIVNMSFPFAQWTWASRSLMSIKTVFRNTRLLGYNLVWAVKASLAPLKVYNFPVVGNTPEVIPHAEMYLWVLSSSPAEIAYCLLVH